MSSTDAHAERDWWAAVKRGFHSRCPECGEGRLFGRFLKIEPRCTALRSHGFGQGADEEAVLGDRHPDF